MGKGHLKHKAVAPNYLHSRFIVVYWNNIEFALSIYLTLSYIV